MPKSTKATKPVKKRVPKQKPAADAKVIKVPKAPKAPLAATTAPEVIVTDEVIDEVVTTEPVEPASAAKKQPTEDVAAETVEEPHAEPAPEVARQVAAEAEAGRLAASPARRRTSPRYLVVVGVLLLLVAGSLRWYSHAHPDSGALTAQNKSLISEVAERVVVPKGETPTITTVVDKDKVNQSFLANAANGDKVLLYFQAGKAIVYRPSTHQVVNIGPLQQPPVKVFLRSGTQAGQIPAAIRNDLNIPAEYTIVSQDVSPKPSYTNTLVIDLSGNRPDIAARVAKTIGGQVSQLPNGETKPDADILIIVGSDTK